ncbi:Rpn family recombination-promoting nuclease/putative transposase [Candidatus Tisiphia endosymbiont of Sialis lutaria]|uniref:Rpn family recombination-promoting nuclease/putative transposase n=1 Tax=Candidatus Tisiphia endosymbiont of Sialis lutaria TaxID=2029164 RepID=UPI00312CA39B
MSNISPRVDIAFKKIFGVEENKDLLISLINSIVSREDQVAEVQLLNPYNPKNFKSDKLSILDIKAQGKDGKRFNIEMQITDEADYDKRALYYWAKLYTEQLKISSGYATLSKAIGIHILNFTSIPNEKKYHNVFHIVEKDSGLLYFKDLELHTIELNKFTNNPKEQLTDIVKKVKNSLDMWSAFLTRHDLLNKDNLPKELNDASLKKALTVLDVMNFTEEERESYEDHLKWILIEANTIKKFEDKGREEGIQIGKAEGKEEGRAEGRAEGKAELIKMMIENGSSIEEVAEITKLSVAKITELLKVLSGGLSDKL